MNNTVHFFINKKCIFTSFKYRDMDHIVRKWYRYTPNIEPPCYIEPLSHDISNSLPIVPSSVSWLSLGMRWFKHHGSLIYHTHRCQPLRFFRICYKFRVKITVLLSTVYLLRILPARNHSPFKYHCDHLDASLSVKIA
jgi:hypothetical protein